VRGADDAALKREVGNRMRARALKMRREGEGFDAIGDRLGLTRARARRLVARELKAVAAESDPGERRLLHVEALMELWRVLYAAALAGDRVAIDQFLRVEERISRLLGLDLGSGPTRGSRIQALAGAREGAKGGGASPPRQAAVASPGDGNPVPGSGGLA
jgi:hypothetical protein